MERLSPCSQPSPQTPVATHAEAHGLMGRGVGWVDIHLMVSARLAGRGLWSLDKRLQAAFERLA